MEYTLNEEKTYARVLQTFRKLIVKQFTKKK